MKDLSLDQINGLIRVYEDRFQRALTRSARPSQLVFIKKDIDYLREIRDSLYKERTSTQAA
jgi:hypothetical protein